MTEWVWSIGSLILTGESEVLGEKLYTAWVVVKWVDLVHWLNDTDRENWSTGSKHYTTSSVDEWICMELWWNDADRGNWCNGRKTLYSVGGSWMNDDGNCWNDIFRENWSTGKKQLQRGWSMDECLCNIGGKLLTRKIEKLGEKILHFRW